MAHLDGRPAQVFLVLMATKIQCILLVARSGEAGAGSASSLGIRAAANTPGRTVVQAVRSSPEMARAGLGDARIHDSRVEQPM